MRTKRQLAKELCAHHLQVRAGVKPSVAVAWNCSCNGWRLLSIASEVVGLAPVVLRQTKNSTKKPKKPTHVGEQQLAPAVGLLQPPAQSPASLLHYCEIFLTVLSTKIGLFSCPSLLNSETSWRAKPTPEDALGAGQRGMLPLQTEVSTPAAQTQEPGSAAGSSTTWTWIGHVRVRRTKPCWGHAPLRPPAAAWRTKPPRGFLLRKDLLFMNVHLLQS